MVHLAVTYQSAGKLNRSLLLSEKVLKLRNAKLGANHPDTLTSMVNLAVILWRLKKLKRSIPLFEKALKIQEVQLGSKHPQTLLTKANLAVNYRDAGRLTESIFLFEEVHQFIRKYPSLRWVRALLMEAYVQAGNSTKIVLFVKENVASAHRTLKHESIRLADVLAASGKILLTMKVAEDAEPYLRECLTIREKKLPDNWLFFNTKSMLGSALAGQKKFDEAEPLLLAGYEGMKKREVNIPAASKAILTEALQRLVDLYTTWNKPDKTAEWQIQLDANKAELQMQKKKSKNQRHIRKKKRDANRDKPLIAPRPKLGTVKTKM